MKSSNLFNPEKKVVMSLVGLNGNAFSLMGAFSSCAHVQGWTKNEVKMVTDACMSGDYNNLLQVLIAHTTEEDIEMDEYYFPDEDDPMGDYGYRD